MKHIIIAPHADDEIIGCWELLRNYEWDTRVIFDEEPTTQQLVRFNRRFPWANTITFTVGTRTEKIETIKTLVQSQDARCYFPDPVYEAHPMHKYWGNIGADLFRVRALDTVYFYTTTMLAPYQREIGDAEEKREALDSIYPEKADLWKYDHKYFLFSGMNQWL